MTETKKIATSVEIMIHVGQFEHIKINKYGEKNIEYGSKEDMIKQENVLTDELINDIIRTMRALPDKLGKKTNAVTEIEEKIEKRIPEWLQTGSEPNIAKKTYESNKSVDNAKKESEKESEKESPKTLGGNPVKDHDMFDETKGISDDEDLFND